MAHLPPTNQESLLDREFPSVSASDSRSASDGLTTTGFYHGNMIIKENTMSRQST